MRRRLTPTTTRPARTTGRLGLEVRRSGDDERRAHRVRSCVVVGEFVEGRGFHHRGRNALVYMRPPSRTFANLDEGVGHAADYISANLRIRLP